MREREEGPSRISEGLRRIGHDYKSDPSVWDIAPGLLTSWKYKNAQKIVDTFRGWGWDMEVGGGKDQFVRVDFYEAAFHSKTGRHMSFSDVGIGASVRSENRRRELVHNNYVSSAGKIDINLRDSAKIVVSGTRMVEGLVRSDKMEFEADGTLTYTTKISPPKAS